MNLGLYKVFIFPSSRFHASFMTESMNEALKLVNLLHLILRLIFLRKLMIIQTFLRMIFFFKAYLMSIKWLFLIAHGYKVYFGHLNAIPGID
jgi:hypothetical protein